MPPSRGRSPPRHRLCVRAQVIPQCLAVRSLLDGSMRKRVLSTKRVYSSKADVAWCKWIQPFVDRSPVPVVTAFDFLWWMTYGLLRRRSGAGDFAQSGSDRTHGAGRAPEGRSGGQRRHAALCD